MPMEFILDATNRIVRTRAWGALTDSDLIDHLNRIKRLFTDATLDASWVQVADFTDVQSFVGVSTAGIRRLARENPWPKESFRVVVAPHNVSFGLARMYQLLGAKTTDSVHITRSTDEAYALLARRHAAPDERL